MFHLLHTDIQRPERFTYPFCYTPHPLSLMAAKEVQEYIASTDVWREEIDKGKMFGVLVVENADGKLGFYAAYSGILTGRNDWSYFVPAIYDILQPDGYFKIHEETISGINKRITKLEKSEIRISLISDIKSLNKVANHDISDYQDKIKEAKNRRDKERITYIDNKDADMLLKLIRESQFMKAELKRKKKRYADRIVYKEEQLDRIDSQIIELKRKRKLLSDDLQHWLFSQFKMLNALGETQDLCKIFEEAAKKVPPAGAGECCAPKLLQYAYLHNARPICMAEFWWGESPKKEIRHHLHYYPACQGKCKPILTHMLKGLDVDDNPLEKTREQDIDVLYNDEWLAVICKPEGMLSVPGNSDKPSVYSIVRNLYPEAEGPIIVHRLDMATSGLMIVTKSKQIHKNLQSQFENHKIKKRYIAMLDGIIEEKKGKISIPISPDYLDRPRQIVDIRNGKAAITEYEVISVENGHTRIKLFPHTGRTHQLRVHCACKDGLDTPILGDNLYGKKADRLYLHAEEITFAHPITGKKIRIEKKADF